MPIDEGNKSTINACASARSTANSVDLGDRGFCGPPQFSLFQIQWHLLPCLNKYWTLANNGQVVVLQPMSLLAELRAVTGRSNPKSGPFHPGKPKRVFCHRAKS